MTRTPVPDKGQIVSRLAEWRHRHDHWSDDRTAAMLGEGDGTLLAPPKPRDGLVPAAVLVPLVFRDEGLSVLLTQRTAHLAHHPGQISFPGGRGEPEDANAVATALREAEEEVGLPPSQVEVAGRLDDYVTVTGFRVVPVVGFLTPPLALAPDTFEVADIFEVPLAFILDPANHQRHFRITPTGEKRHYYAIPFEGRYIWGATAGMLINLHEVLTHPCAS